MILGASRSDGYGLLRGPSDESHFTVCSWQYIILLIQRCNMLTNVIVPQDKSGFMRSSHWYSDVLLQHVLWITNWMDFNDVAPIVIVGLCHVQTFQRQTSPSVRTY
jgi:hypothetical protein